MPHLRLEYSANVMEKETITDLFAKMHHMLSEQLPTKLLSCKSRSTEYQVFYLGDGETPSAFVHLELKASKGRSTETLNKVGEQLLAILHQHFSQTARSLQLEISLEIVELQDTYFSPWLLPSKA